MTMTKYDDLRLMIKFLYVSTVTTYCCMDCCQDSLGWLVFMLDMNVGIYDYAY